MLNPKDFFEILNIENGYEYFCGVPDSTLKSFCSFVDDHAKDHLICANEGSAIGNAIGYHLATNKVPVIYMQNSGFGNAINPILSMASKEIYQIPMLIIIGWRGEPGLKDEPQHIHQGKVLLPSLDSMELDYDILPTKYESTQKLITDITSKIKSKKRPYFLVVKKGTFDNYESKQSKSLNTLNRIEVIKEITQTFRSEKFISSTGYISRELFQIREETNTDHSLDFLTIGAMGHASQIAYSYAKHSKKRTICLDGDGSFLMHMGGATAIKSRPHTNIIHIVLNNGAHLSVGGQPTIAEKLSLDKIASECGFEHTYSVSSQSELTKTLTKIKDKTGPIFIDIKVNKEIKKDLMRPNLSPLEMKNLFME